MPAPSTRDAILDAAETMLAEHGYAATSMRQLTTAAGVNLAAVNYHFGGKEELTKAVLRRRIEPINAERHRRLDLLGLGQPSVADIVRAFIEPPLRAAGPVKSSDAESGKNGGTQSSRMGNMFGRILVEQPPFLRSFLAAQFGDILERFLGMFGKTLRAQGKATTWWRLHFAIGAMAHTLQNAAGLAHMSGGLCDPTDTDGLIEELVAFATAGFEAPAPVTREEQAR